MPPSTRAQSKTVWRPQAQSSHELSTDMSAQSAPRDDEKRVVGDMTSDTKALERSQCILIAEIGPNPAPLIELVWALARQKNVYTDRVLVLYHNTPTFKSLQTELDYAWSWLTHDCPDLQLRQDMLIYRELSASESEMNTPVEHTRRWDCFHEALRAAEDLGAEVPMVCGLTSGRRRSSAAMSSVFFQMLARHHDVCFDVRVSRREVEGARAGFYFPEQSATLYECDFEARDVEIILDEIILPRFYNLLSPHERQSYPQALESTLRWASHPKESARLHLATSTFSLVSHQIKLPPAQVTYLALVALAEAETERGLPKQLTQLVKLCRDPTFAPKFGEVISAIYHEHQPRSPTHWIDYLCHTNTPHFPELIQHIRTTRSKLQNTLARAIKCREKLLVDDQGSVRLGGVLIGLSLH